MGESSLRSSISLSVGGHVLLFVACLLFLSQRAAHPVKPLTWIELDPLPKRALKKPNDHEHHQIVQTESGRRVKEAADDAYLGAQNQVVDSQSVSKEKTIVMGHKPAQPQVGLPTREEAQPQAVPLSHFGVPIKPQSKDWKEAVLKEREETNWASQGTLPQDFVKGVRESERTALNTKEFVYYGYYQRIRERLDRAWVPILREKLLRMYRTGRRLASDMDHTTRLIVILNARGEITRVNVLSESGTLDLDDAAVKAFNRAGPFPNPPKGIADASGEIQIPWNFILKN